MADLILSDKYKAFLRCMAPVEFLEGTTAAGKTTVGIFKFMLRVAESPKRQHILSGLDTGTIEKNIINKELGILDIFEGLVEYNPNGRGAESLPHLLYRTPNGEKIVYVLGYDNRALIDKIFTEEERYLIYKHENARWYYRCGTAIHPILANNMAQSRIYVDYVVERVDAALSGESNYKANLCFGHDLNIIPIQNIFGLDNMPLYFSLENNTVDYIAEHWRGYKITPKAANIFLIFYRNKEGKVLVRPQMNERDVEMPIESETPHFYEWEKVKELAYARLAEIDELKKGAF